MACPEASQDLRHLQELRETALCCRGPRGELARRRLHRHTEGSAARAPRARHGSSPRRTEAEDEEYRALYEKYGHRLRVPRPPEARPRRSEAASTRRRSPSEDPGRGSLSARERRGDSSSVSEARSSALPQIPMSARGTAQSEAGAVAAPAAPGEAAASRLAAGRSAPSHVSASDGEGEISEPSRSLMPRKELLRKRQQALLKKTEVVHYRGHMRKQFQKILEAVELTYSESSGHKVKEVHRNLAKPELQDKFVVGAHREE